MGKENTKWLRQAELALIFFYQRYLMVNSAIDIIMIFVYTQITLFPLLGLVWLGLRNENNRRERLLNESLRALSILAVAKGNRR